MTVRRTLGSVLAMAAAACEGGGAAAPADAPVVAAHDEDGDGVADALDDCPHVADPDQADRGERAVGAAADGVGDACDPEPAVPGDRIALFDPMIALPATAPGAVVDGDAVRIERGGAVVLDTAVPGHAVVQAGLRVVGDAGRGGVVVGRLQQPGGCWRDTAPDGRLALDGGDATTWAAAPPVADGVALALTARTAAGRWRCDSTSDGVTTSATDPRDRGDAPAAAPHLYPLAGTLGVDYLVVITLAP